MSELPIYPWFDQVPEGLKTRKQLAEQGLRPGGPVTAQVVWKQGKRWADLYAVADAKPKREMTEAQRAALDKAQQKLRTCPACGTVHRFVLGRNWRPELDCNTCYERARERIRHKACKTAHAWLNSPETIILDTETTGLDGYLVQLAVINTSGAVLFDSLIKPEAPISSGAAEIHGLSEEQLRDAPTFADLAGQISALLTERRIVTYNADFDRGIFRNEIERLTKRRSLEGGLVDTQEAARLARQNATIWCEFFRWRCAMNLYARYVGEWSRYHQSYKWQPLPGGDHSALGDARACLDVLKRMAAGVTE